MLGLYLFGLVLGGGFLAVSLLGGLGGEDLAHAHDAPVANHGDAAVDAKIFSLRALIYALFGFGAAGTVLTVTGAGTALTAVAAAAAGLTSAVLVEALFRWVRSEELPEGPGDEAYVGLAGRVLLPITPGSPGTIAVEHAARRITLRAVADASHPDLNTEGWRSVVVVDMRDGIALVVPVEDELIAES